MKLPLIAFSFICLLCFTTCTSEKDNLIDVYVNLEEAIEKGNTKAILNLLDEPSLHYYKIITDTSSVSINSPITVGKFSSVELTTVSITKDISQYLQQTGNRSSFFEFLSQKYIAPFNLKTSFEVVRERTRVMPEHYVVVGIEQFGRRYLKWIKFNKENGEYKLDLLYLLQLYDRELQEQFAYFRKRNGQESSTELTSKYMDLYREGTNTLDKRLRVGQELHYDIIN